MNPETCLFERLTGMNCPLCRHVVGWMLLGDNMGEVHVDVVAHELARREQAIRAELQQIGSARKKVAAWQANKDDQTIR